MNVLITSASRKVGLVKAFQEALAEEGGGKVIANDVDPRSAALYFADEGYCVPNGDIWELVIDKNIQLIVPTRDEELAWMAVERGTFNKRGITVAVSDLPVVQICQDKLEFAEFCVEEGFAIPTVYPSVIKRPRRGKASKGIEVVRGTRDFIIQEFVNAPEYTVDLFADFDGRVISVVPRRRVKTFGGESFIGVTEKNWQIIDEASRLAKKLGLVYHNTMQCFLDDGVVKWIEVNPRYGGGAALGFTAGAFTPRYLVRLAMGKKVEPMIGDFREGLYMLRYTEDLFVHESDLLGADDG